MADESAGTGPLDRVDQEFTTQRTFSTSSASDEAHPEVNPQNPAELFAKGRAEASEGDGVVDKAKRVLQELDRDTSGVYEARQDPDAPDPKTD